MRLIVGNLHKHDSTRNFDTIPPRDAASSDCISDAPGRPAMTTDSLAYPPRGMSRDEAARYVGVGATKFDEMVADGRMPRPKRVDGRVVWDRIKLDMAFSDLPEDTKTNPLAPR
jgi:excisionase family DNA binding protein